MHDQRRLERPAAPGFRFDLLKRRLGHARVMLQRQRIDTIAMIALAHMQLAHQPDEYREPADLPVALGDGIELGAGVEVRFLNAYGHGYPPVNGGKNATSLASLIATSIVAVRLSTAAPNAAPSASASAWPPLRLRSQATRSPTVRTSAGGVTSSSGTPTVRFIQAKYFTFIRCSPSTLERPAR